MAEHISLVVNGQPREGDVEPRRMLVQFLREDLELTGTHVGCDTSQCGACTVHVDGRAVKSCTILAVQADGAAVTTIEGMQAGDGALHPLQAAFWEKHGLQCGFCTPGMIMAAADLLARYDRSHGRRDPPRARRQHLPLHGLPQHRGRDPRSRVRDARPAPRRPSPPTPEPRLERSTAMAIDVPDVLGKPVKRVEDPRFITGKGRYLDDIHLQGMTHMAILRSPYAHANIRSVDVSAARTRARRPGGVRRGGHPVEPAADGLARRRLGRDPEQRQHAPDPRDGQRQVDRRGRRGRRRRDGRAGGRRARGDPGRLRAAARGRRRREGDPARRAAAPRQRPEQRGVRVDGRRQGRAPRRRSRTPRSSSSSASSTIA